MPYPVVCRFPLHWGEMDSLGHANNARFFTWMESARIEYASRAGFLGGASGTGPILASVRCDFLRPVVFPAEIEVGVRVVRLGTTSIEMEYGISLGKDGTQVARGWSVLVLVSYATNGKVPIPDDVRRTIEGIESRSFS